MYYRRKLILALNRQFGSLSKTELQKLLFLFCDKQEIPSFHFVPYKFGCFSFQANQDLSTMVKYGLIKEINNHWQNCDDIDYLHQLNSIDKLKLNVIYNQFKNIRSDELIKYTYLNYPYYAINSEILNKYFNNEEIEKYRAYRPQKNISNIYTIGYEGKSVEEYLNILIHKDIKVLVDVRKNPLSMKYGFSKNQLKLFCNNIGIEYIHIPELGIESEKRKELNSENAYKTLFDDYELNCLSKKEFELKKIVDLFIENKRIALTCFEADSNFCHRSRITKVIMLNYDNISDVIHL